MENIIIKTLNEISNRESVLVVDQIKEIFFMSSDKKTFKDDEDKKLFFQKWCGDYLELYPETVFLAFNSSDILLGYLTGTVNTLESMKKLKVPGLKVFEDLYLDFPAHLHINAHENSRGLGIGSKLIRAFEEKLIKLDISGLHLITSEDSLNTKFYKKNGFDKTHLRKLNSYDLFFMGKSLKA